MLLNCCGSINTDYFDTGVSDQAWSASDMLPPATTSMARRAITDISIPAIRLKR